MRPSGLFVVTWGRGEREGGKEERGCMVREGEGWWYGGKVVHGEGRKMVL